MTKCVEIVKMDSSWSPVTSTCAWSGELAGLVIKIILIARKVKIGKLGGEVGVLCKFCGFFVIQLKVYAGTFKEELSLL